jgi:hypothetical protein
VGAGGLAQRRATALGACVVKGIAPSRPLADSTWGWAAQ